MTKSLLPAAALIALLSACDSAPDLALHDPMLRHPLAVRTAPATQVIAAGDFERVSAAGADFLRRGEGLLTVSLVANDEADPAVRAAAAAIADRLLAEGVPEQSLRLQLLLDAPEPAGSVLIDFQRVGVVLPDCPNWTESSPGWRNQPSSNFGCALQSNVGMMVADPRDLLQGRPYGGRAANRSDDVYGKWAVGAETTSAPVRNWSSQSGGGR